MKKHIPNLFTLANLCCGVLASIVIIQESDYTTAAYLVLVGAGFDFLDGLVARALNVAGELGKQLDSLADMVTFGLVPGLIAMSLCSDFDSSYGNNLGTNWMVIVPIIITLMSAMRLAIFNISTDQTDSFKGVPVPANTLFWIGMPFLLEYLEVYNIWVVIALSVISAIWLVMNYTMLALKFKSYGLKGNHGRWLLVVLSIGTLIILTTITGNMLIALPIIIILYLIVSVINNSLSK